MWNLRTQISRSSRGSREGDELYITMIMCNSRRSLLRVLLERQKKAIEFGETFHCIVMSKSTARAQLLVPSAKLYQDLCCHRLRKFLLHILIQPAHTSIPFHQPLTHVLDLIPVQDLGLNP